MVFTGTDDGDGKEKCVLVFINRNESVTINIAGTDSYASYEIYTTSEKRDLERTAEGTVAPDTEYEIGGESVVTVVFSK